MNMNENWESSVLELAFKELNSLYTGSLKIKGESWGIIISYLLENENYQLLQLLKSKL